MPDPQALAAFAEENSNNPFTDGPVDEDMMDEEAEGGDAEGMDGDTILDEMGDFGAMLRENADMIVPMAEEIGEDLAGDSTYMEETKIEVEDAVERMPDELVEGMAENLADKSPEELVKIGEALCKSVDTEVTPEGEAEQQECEQVGGLLEIAAEVAAGAPMDDEEGDEEEEDEEEEDEEEEDEEDDDLGEDL